MRRRGMRSRLWPTDPAERCPARSVRPCSDPPPMTSHRITVEPTSLGDRGHRYRVTYVWMLVTAIGCSRRIRVKMRRIESANGRQLPIVLQIALRRCRALNVGSEHKPIS